MGVADKTLGETAAPALPGRPAISLAKQHLLLRKETHHQRARLSDLLTPGIAGVNGKNRTMSTKKPIEYYGTGGETVDDRRVSGRIGTGDAALPVESGGDAGADEIQDFAHGTPQGGRAIRLL